MRRLRRRAFVLVVAAFHLLVSVSGSSAVVCVEADGCVEIELVGASGRCVEVARPDAPPQSLAAGPDESHDDHCRDCVDVQLGNPDSVLGKRLDRPSAPDAAMPVTGPAGDLCSGSFRPNAVLRNAHRPAMPLAALRAVILRI